MTETRVTRLIAIAALVTLAITLVRLIGELRGWDPRWFGTDAGGNASPLGISWLVPVLGWWFGAHLARRGSGPRSRVAAIAWPLLGIALAVGVMLLVLRAMEQPTVGPFLAICATNVACAALALPGWPELFRSNLAYGVAARLPIIVITVIAVANGWSTHHTKMAPGSPALPDAQRTLVLCTAQVAMWLPFTVLIGGLFGGIAAAVHGRRRG